MNEQESKRGEGLFFDEHQWATVEAAMTRIIPTDHEPGAKEAGTVGFADRYLSGIGYIYAEPDGSGFEELTGKRADAWQERIDMLRQAYTVGLEELDRRSREAFGEDFRRLSGEQQDAVLGDLEKSGDAEEKAEEKQATAGYGAPPEEAEASEPAMQQTLTEIELDFFTLLVLHTRQGFYSDPIYGGNKERAGWRVIGFPGPESLDDVHKGRYSVLPYFAEGNHIQEEEDGR